MGEEPDYGRAVQQAHRLFWFPGLQIFCCCCLSFKFLIPAWVFFEIKVLRLGLDGSASGAGLGRRPPSGSSRISFWKGRRSALEPSQPVPLWPLYIFFSLSSLHPAIHPLTRSLSHPFISSSSPFRPPSFSSALWPTSPSNVYTHTHMRTHEVEGSLEKSLARMFIAQHFQLSPAEHILQHDKGITPCVQSEVVNSGWLLSPVKT